MSTLRVSEIFDSIQGESHWAGYPCTFLRLSGCNLDCAWCDTRFARAPEGGTVWAAEDLLRALAGRRQPMIEVTGGEPLLQEATPSLLSSLLELGRRVLLETNGSVPLDGVPEGAHVIMDLKAPGSGMDASNHWPNLDRLRLSDEVKIVLRDRDDWEWALQVCNEYRLPARMRVSLSPVHGELAPQDLAAWMVAEALDARLQLQLHRVLWPTRDRGV